MTEIAQLLTQAKELTPQLKGFVAINRVTQSLEQISRCHTCLDLATPVFGSYPHWEKAASGSEIAECFDRAIEIATRETGSRGCAPEVTEASR